MLMRIRIQPAVVWALVVFGVVLGVASEALSLTVRLTVSIAVVGLLLLVTIAVKTSGRRDDPNWQRQWGKLD